MFMAHRVAVPLLLAALLPGCATVTVQQPIGEPVDTDFAKKLEGTWRTSDATFRVRHVADNELRAATLGHQEKGEGFQLSKISFLLTREQEVYYLHLPQGGAKVETKPPHTFLRLAVQQRDHDPNRIAGFVLHGANVPWFRNAVEEGRIAGDVEKEQNVTTVRITADAKAVNELIDPDRAGVQFKLDHPIILHRLGPAD